MATPATPVKSTHGSPTHPQLQSSTNISHPARNHVSSTQQNQEPTSSAETFYRNTCRADVIPTDELIEATYGKIDDLHCIRAILEGGQSLSDSGWQALYNPEMNSYLPSDSPLEEDKLFEGLGTDARVPLGSPRPIVRSNSKFTDMLVSNFPMGLGPMPPSTSPNHVFRGVDNSIDHAGELTLRVRRERSPALIHNDNEETTFLSS
jgi:hypothetical protein